MIILILTTLVIINAWSSGVFSPSAVRVAHRKKQKASRGPGTTPRPRWSSSGASTRWCSGTGSASVRAPGENFGRAEPPSWGGQTDGLYGGLWVLLGGLFGGVVGAKNGLVIVFYALRITGPPDGIRRQASALGRMFCGSVPLLLGVGRFLWVCPSFFGAGALCLVCVKGKPKGTMEAIGGHGVRSSERGPAVRGVGCLEQIAGTPPSTPRWKDTAWWDVSPTKSRPI